MGITTALNTTVGSNPFLKMMSKLLVALLSPSPLMLRLDTWATPPPSSTPTPTGPEGAPPTASPPATDADPDTPMARGPLMPRLRLIPPSCTELTDTVPTPTLPMELTPTDTDTVLPESLVTPEPPPPSLPGLPRVSARGLLMPTPLSFTEHTAMVPSSPETPTAMAPLDTASPRDTPALPAPSSPSPDCTKKQPIIY